MIKTITVIFFLSVFMVTHAGLGFCSESDNAAEKFARGFANAGFGWLELLVQPIQVKEDQGEIAGMTWGVVKGLLCFVGRECLGVYEVVTFPIPPYRPLVTPEYVLPHS